VKYSSLWAISDPDSGGERKSAPAHEKKAIFSAWLMRRIGASGSDAEAMGLRTIPLAIRLEPRERSVEG
jgi:hypothetical protein